MIKECIPLVAQFTIQFTAQSLLSRLNKPPGLESCQVSQVYSLTPATVTKTGNIYKGAILTLNVINFSNELGNNSHVFFWKGLYNLSEPLLTSLISALDSWTE